MFVLPPGYCVRILPAETEASASDGVKSEQLFRDDPAGPTTAVTIFAQARDKEF